MSIELYGLVRLKAINSPNYFNNIRNQLFFAFQDEETVDAARQILEKSFNPTDNDNKNKFNFPPSLINKTTDIFKNIFLTSGIFNNIFLEGKIKIEGINSPFNKIKDTIAEIVIRDGIVSKIDIIKYPEIE
jgi:hypothetical protein